MKPRAGSATESSDSMEKRLHREDWIAAAWDALGRGNLNDIKVKTLAEKLGVTRGSFYWHFGNRQELLDALVDRWFAMLGFGQVMKPALELIEEPDAQLWATFRMVIINIDAGQSVAFRLLSKRDLKLRRRIETEDQQRLVHFAGLFEKLGFPGPLAAEKARIYHAVVMSEYLRNGALTRAERLADAKRMHATLTSSD